MFVLFAIIIEHLFDPIIRHKAILRRTVFDHAHIISHKHPYWNRSLGADHFMLSCHDWGPRATWYVPQPYYNSIRVLCKANTSEHFNPKKDASVPEINLITGEITYLTGGLPPSNRTILALFAELSYKDTLKKSRFCICPGGHEVASPRIVEVTYAECVPGLISQHHVLPFSDVLNWESFSVQVPVKCLKKILMGVSQDRYFRMYEQVKMVQRHFVVNNPSVRYDAFNMIIPSIWLRRLNVCINCWCIFTPCFIHYYYNY
ncbi:putative glycosyltransferase [Citrus sinensis]|uniref:Exostosin GT47 domain-containing protein n=1 Tax=Citrus clementina TaxID=85681 RepID=V4U579_CITCL|nr:hypothetical protein CICLE_v10018108mg [Citrus x clementina]KAH9745445.1 putative glycosyltransferase [Citrus sinensis]